MSNIYIQDKTVDKTIALGDIFQPKVPDWREVKVSHCGSNGRSELKPVNRCTIHFGLEDLALCEEASLTAFQILLESPFAILISSKSFF